MSVRGYHFVRVQDQHRVRCQRPDCDAPAALCAHLCSEVGSRTVRSFFYTCTEHSPRAALARRWSGYSEAGPVEWVLGVARYHRLNGSSTRYALRMLRVAARLRSFDLPGPTFRPGGPPGCRHSYTEVADRVEWEIRNADDSGGWCRLASRLVDERPFTTPARTDARVPDVRPGCYYVSAVIGGDSYLVAGPYLAHAVALELVGHVRRHADRVDASGRAFTASWGTARTEDPRPTILGPWQPPQAQTEAPQPPRAPRAKRPARAEYDSRATRPTRRS